MRRAGALALGLAIVVAGAVVAVNLAGHSRPAAAATPPAATSLAAIQKRTITSQLSVSGTLGYSGSYSVLNAAQGHYTQLPAQGQIVKNGGVLYEVDGSPIILLYGSTPAYRTLAEGLTGADVKQLNADLVALGYVSRSDLDPSSDAFDWATRAGVEHLQAHLGVTQSGSLSLGAFVFLPSEIRITSVQPVLGSAAAPGSPVASATSTTRRVVVNLDASQQTSVKAGDQVSITLPGGQPTPGKVASVGTVASTPSGNGNGGGGNPTVEVDITPTDPAATGTLDAAPVQVSITTAAAANALVAPVTALLATASGGYDVEVVVPGGRHQLVPVTLGLFDDADGLVQITGSGLEAGQMVVVAGT
ncbi:MAG TPA: peptidoglycan-binding protein [Candidatus Dormibacteraeota bacterium]